MINSDIENIIKIKNIDELNVFVEKRKSENLKLSSDEKLKYLNFLSTLKHSFIFWDNSLSNDELLLGDNTNIINRERFPEGWRWKYWACDAVGAIFGGPAGAAAASLCYAISIL